MSADPPPLTRDQLRQARIELRERNKAVRKEREFQERLIATLSEGQNAINIAFGAILSAYVGNVLAGIDNKAFDAYLLAVEFVLIGIAIAGLCVGNSILLRRHYRLGISFLAVGAVAGYFSIDTASSLGFELPILKVLYLCWFAMLIVTDAVLTFVIFLHHQGLA